MTLPADAKTFLRHFKALTQFAESLEEAGDIELQTKEMEQRRADAEKVRDTTLKELEGVKRQVVEARGKLRELEEKATSTVEAANKEAAYIVDVARDKAIDIKTDADAAASEVLTSTKQELAEIRQEIGRLDKQKGLMIAENDELQNAIDELKRKFN